MTCFFHLQLISFGRKKRLDSIFFSGRGRGGEERPKHKHMKMRGDDVPSRSSFALQHFR